MTEFYIGLMSGTSLDGVDGVLAAFDVGDAHAPLALRVVAHAWQPFEADLRAELLALNTPGDNELHRAALAANRLVELYASITQRLLDDGQLAAGDVRAIGAHGQTVRHRPREFDGTGYTWQLNNPALLAERCGIDVVADLRSRDLAAGGQGAPLVPAFHQAFFGQPDRTVAALNIGGISNITIVPPRPQHATASSESAWGFDCGPGNVLMDLWTAQHQQRPYDQDGAWAASGRVDAGLLQALLAEPYLRQPPPKSTGRDLFHADWLQARLATLPRIEPVDVQATLAEFTAQVCAQALQAYAPDATEFIVCGGGALNGHLMRRLQQVLPGIGVVGSRHRGLPPLQVEATAFAWLARALIHHQPANLPRATGARGPRLLGALYLA